MYSEPDFSIAMGVFIGFFVLILAIFLVCYVLTSKGLQNMVDKRGLENSWSAWLPISNMYLLGKIVGDRLKIGAYVIPNLSLVLVVLTVSVIFLGNIPVLGGLVVIAYLILLYCTYYKMYKIFKPESANLYLLLSIVLVIVQPLLIFIISKNEPDLGVVNEGTVSNEENNALGKSKDVVSSVEEDDLWEELIVGKDGEFVNKDGKPIFNVDSDDDRFGENK